MSKARTYVVLEEDPRGGYAMVETVYVHAYECPFWRQGKRHGPCNCGACELEEKWPLGKALDAARRGPGQ